MAFGARNHRESKLGERRVEGLRFVEGRNEHKRKLYGLPGPCL